ncbi:MAG TPA: tail fiber domain-containing protein [Rhizomicrobium sp.]|jgi:hypothetical protein
MYKLIAEISFALLLSGGSAMATCSSYPYSLTNGTTADATQVMANFNCASLTANPIFSGLVGVNTASPMYTMDVQSSAGANIRAKATSSSSAGLVLDRYSNSLANASEISFESGGSSDFAMGTSQGSAPSDAFSIYDYGISSNPFTILKSSGYVGIATISPSYPLHVNGTAYATGAAGALSDIRHKKDVASLEDGSLDDVMRLRPVSFLWRDPKDDGMKGRQMGFIAQEVEQVLPTAVLTENNAEKTKGLKYNEITAVLTKALQEQQAEILALKAANDNQVSEIGYLRTQLNVLEQQAHIRTAQR